MRRKALAWIRAHMLWISIAALLIPALPILSDYPMRVMTMALIYSLLALSLNLLTGICGQVSLGHAAFYAVGAYASALITLRLNMPFGVGLVSAIVVAGALGYLVYLPSRRVTGGYLAIVTMGLGEIVRLTLLNWSDLTRGPMGLPGIPAPELFGHAIYAPYEYYLLVLPFTLLALLMLTSLKRSKFGRDMLAVRADETAAEAMAIDPQRTKRGAFIMSAAIAGLAGSLYAHFIGFIDPGSFRSDESITILCMVALGGMGNLPGSILAAFALTILPEFLRGLDNVRMLVYGALLTLLMLRRAVGAGGLKRACNALMHRHTAGSSAAKSEERS